MTDQRTEDIFNFLPTTSCERECNLRNNSVVLHMLNHQCFLTLALIVVNAYMAMLANFLTNCSAIHIKGPEESLNVTETFT